MGIERDKRWRGQRALLNGRGHCTTAAVVAEVEDTSGWAPGCNGKGQPITKERLYSLEPEVTFAISNCDRTILFEIDFDSRAGRRNSLAKVDRLIRALSEFRDGLEEEFELYASRLREVPDGE